MAKKIMTVNYFGPVGLSKALLAARGRGNAGGRSTGIHFVVVNSVQGKFGIAFRSSYTASKHALVGFFDCLRAETSHLGVRVTSVFPGYIRTKCVFTGGKAGQSVRLYRPKYPPCTGSPLAHNRCVTNFSRNPCVQITGNIDLVPFRR